MRKHKSQRSNDEKNRSPKPNRHLTALESRTIIFLAILLLAGICVLNNVGAQAFWAFLATASGFMLGSSGKK